TVGHRKFAIQTFAVSVDGVRRNAIMGGNGKFGAVVKNVFDNLKLPSGKFKAAGNFIPNLFGKHRRPQRASQLMTGRAHGWLPASVDWQIWFHSRFQESQGHPHGIATALPDAMPCVNDSPTY